MDINLDAHSKKPNNDQGDNDQAHNNQNSTKELA